MNAKILEFYLGAISSSWRDEGTTTPSNRLSPAVARREKIGWRLAVTAWGLHKFTLFETIDKTRSSPARYRRPELPEGQRRDSEEPRLQPHGASWLACG